MTYENVKVGVKIPGDGSGSKIIKLCAKLHFFYFQTLWISQRHKFEKEILFLGQR